MQGCGGSRFRQWAYAQLHGVHGSAIFDCFGDPFEGPPRLMVAIPSAKPIGTRTPDAGMGIWPTEPFVTSHKRAAVDFVSQRSV